MEGQIQALWPGSISLQVWEQTTWYELCYYFLPAFPSLTPEDIRPLSVFGRLFANSIFVHDHLADREAAPRDVATTTLRIMAMQLEAYHVLHGVFPPGARFWGRLRGYIAEYGAACLEELSFAADGRPWREYTEELALRVAAGKSGPSRAILAGLAELAGDEDRLGPLVDALSHYNVACQMWDDLTDWKDDLVHGTPSLLLARAFPDRTGKLAPEALRAETGKLGREIYYRGHASHTLGLALRSLDAAERARGGFPDLPLWPLITTLREKYRSSLEDIDRIIEENLRRARGPSRPAVVLPEPRGEWQRLAWAGVRFLVDQWHKGFGEARDMVQYSGELELANGQSTRFGDVFQRALVLDALCDAEGLLLDALRPVIAAEADYLVGRRLTTGVGGWAYFHDLPELPPDTDDLAQVMQALLRAGRRADVEEHCERPLGVALRDGALPDGSIKTWIIPAAGRTPEQERQVEYVQRLWSDGAHDEVIANLLHALRLYDPARFEGVIGRGMGYLASRQGGDGRWPSMWYLGPYYSIHVGVRLFAGGASGRGPVARALEHLRGRQRPDGGFGLDGEDTDALSTALALLALAGGAGLAADPGDPGRAARALGYLEEARGEDGSWPSRELIYVGRDTFHGSRTVTTLFVVKAALAWHRRLTS